MKLLLVEVFTLHSPELDVSDFLHCAFEGGNLFLGQIATQVKRYLSKGFFVQWFGIDNHTVQIKKNGLQVVSWALLLHPIWSTST
jgi:hypothetical protein